MGKRELRWGCCWGSRVNLQRKLSSQQGPASSPRVTYCEQAQLESNGLPFQLGSPALELPQHSRLQVERQRGQNC